MLRRRAAHVTLCTTAGGRAEPNAPYSLCSSPFVICMDCTRLCHVWVVLWFRRLVIAVRARLEGGGTRAYFPTPARWPRCVVYTPSPHLYRALPPHPSCPQCPSASPAPTPANTAPDATVLAEAAAGGSGGYSGAARRRGGTGYGRGDAAAASGPAVQGYVARRDRIRAEVGAEEQARVRLRRAKGT